MMKFIFLRLFKNVVKSRFNIKYIPLYINNSTILMLFSATILTNGNMIITIINPYEVLNYFKSVIPNIKMPFSKVCYNFDFYTPQTLAIKSNLNNNYLLDNIIKKNHTNIEIVINSMNNHYYNTIWADILNLYYHNHHLFIGIIGLFVWQILPKCKNSFFSIFNNIYNHLNNIFVYTNRDVVTIFDLQNELSPLIDESNRLLAQLEGFINRFNSFVINNNINVITDTQGNMEIEVSNGVNDNQATLYSNTIHTLDNLIRNHINTIEQLVTRGNQLENNILNIDNSYNRQFYYINIRLHNLKANYAHY